MASKQNGSVVHRICRGRTLPEAKSKTDSGCFVDEEIEKLAASTAARKSSSHALPAVNKGTKEKPGVTSEGNSCLTDLNQNISLSDLDKHISSDIFVLPNNDVNGQERGMGDETRVTPEPTSSGSSTGETTGETSFGRNVIHRKSSEFYCLCYDDLAEENSPTTDRQFQLNGAQSFGSHDSLTLPGVEELQGTANARTLVLGPAAEVTKSWSPADGSPTGAPGVTRESRESLSEGQHFHTESHIVVNSSDHVPLACAEKDDLSFADDVGGEIRPEMAQTKRVDHRHSSKATRPNDGETNVEQQHNIQYQDTDMQHSEERYHNELSLNPSCLPDNTSVNGLLRGGNLPGEVHDEECKNVPAGRSGHGIFDETDGTLLPGAGERHLTEYSTYDQANGRPSSVLARVKEIEELQVVDRVQLAKKRPVSVAGYPGGWSPANTTALKHRSWSVIDTSGECGRQEPESSRQEQAVLSRVHGFEERVSEAVSDPTVHKTGNLARLLLDSVAHVDRTFVDEPEQGINDTRSTQSTILPSRIVEGAKEDLLSELALQHKASRGVRSGSFAAEHSNNSDSPPPNGSGAWKRRSWSVCDKITRDLAFPFVGEDHPLPAVRTTKSQQSRDFNSSPYVRRVQNTEAVGRRHSTPSKVRQGFAPERSQSYADFELTQQARGCPQYWSENDRVSSEGEFPPRAARHWTKGSRLTQSCSSTCYDTSSASDFSGTESEMSFSSSARQHRHSLNLRHSFNNVIQQEFSECSDSDSEARNCEDFSSTLDPRVRELRRLSNTTCSSSSDSEVERYFKEPVKLTGQHSRGRKARKRTSALEALYGRHSSRPSTPVTEDLLQGFGTREQTLTLSERFTTHEEALDTTLTKEQNKSAESDFLELEFDDTDYSEFYTRCEDQQSILTAEALHVKEVLAKMEQMDDAVSEHAEQAIDIPQGNFNDENESCSNETDYSADSCSVAIQTEEEDDRRAFSSRRRSRGTQTPPPYPSVKTPSTRDKGAQTPPPPPSSSKAISAEELLEILSSLSTGNLSAPFPHGPVRESLSVQKYNYRTDFLAPEGRASSTGSISTGSENSWQHFTEPQSPAKSTFNQYAVENCRPPLYSQSYDCIRRDLFGSHEDTARNQRAARMSIHEELLKYKEAKMKQAVFEEEIDCVKAKSEGSLMNSANEDIETAERPLSISFVGSEPTGMIEGEVKLAGPVHSLKRKRAGKMIVEESQEEEEAILVSDQITATAENEQLEERAEEDDLSSDSSGTSDEKETEENNKESDAQESGVNVFIDYRKKNVMHVINSSESALSVQNEDSGRTLSQPGLPEGQSRPTPSPPNDYDEDLYSIREERSPSFDSESISSSQSSEDDPFGDFSGSNETVVFVGAAAERVSDTSLLDSVLRMGIGNCLQETRDGELGQGMCDLDAILGRVRKSVDFEASDSSVLDQAIERFKQRVSPRSQDKLTGGMTMEAFVALNQADELEGIINEIKGELKVLQEENSILREKVDNLANDQTMESSADQLTKSSSINKSSPVVKQNGAPIISSSAQGQADEHADQNTDQEENLKLASGHEHSSVKQNESGQHVNSSRDTVLAGRSSAVYKSSKKNHETGGHFDKSRASGPAKELYAVQRQRQTNIHVKSEQKHVPSSGTLGKCLSVEQGHVEKQVERIKRAGAKEKINGVCERPSTRFRQTGKEQEVHPAGEVVEIDVCLRGFTMVPGVPIPLKKTDVRLGTVAVSSDQEDLSGVIEAAKKTFVDHIKKIDAGNCLGLGPHSIQGVQAGVTVWTPGSLKKHQSPRVILSRRNNPCVIQLKDGNHFSCDTVVYDTLLPRELVENYALQLLEHKYIIFCGVEKMGKSYLASKLAEQVVQRIGWNKSPAVLTLNVVEMTRKDLKQKLSALMQRDLSSAPSGTPAVIILDQLNCLASMADIFDVSQLEGNTNSPYIIGVRDKSKKGPFTSKDLNLHQYFRWIQLSVFDKQYFGMLGRFLKRKLCWAGLSKSEETPQLLDLFEWLSLVWKHINGILVGYCDQDSTLGPSVFFSCPMNFKAAEGWFASVWNYTIIPHLHQKLRMGSKIFDRDTVWEDPTRWVILRYPWERENSKVLGILRKLRQVDVVLNRTHTGQDSVAWAECHEMDQRIRRSHSTRSPGSRQTVQRSSITPRRTGQTSSASSFSAPRLARLGTGV